MIPQYKRTGLLPARSSRGARRICQRCPSRSCPSRSTRIPPCVSPPQGTQSLLSYNRLSLLICIYIYTISKRTYTLQTMLKNKAKKEGTLKELGTLSITYRPYLKVENQTQDVFNLFAEIIHVGYIMYEITRLIKFTCDW